MGLARLTAPAAWRAALGAVARGGIDLLLPLACAACRRPVGRAEDGIVCGGCWARLALLPHPQCPRCGHPSQGRRCGWCDALPPFVRAVRSVCWVDVGSGLAIVHALKYDGWHRAAAGMAARMARLAWPQDVLDERAMLVPVPLSAARQRERGYNQSAALAAALAGQWGTSVPAGVLERSRATATQTRLTPAQRMRNVANAFRVPEPARRALRGAHVVIVDDVVTTAATLVACATALRAGGARIISCVTFGRAPASGDR